MDKELTSKQKIAMTAIIDGQSITQAAAAAQVDRRTISRWLNEPHFFTVLRKANDSTFKASARRLAANVDAATDAVISIVKDEKAAASIRLRAAELIYSHSPRLLEAGDLLERIEALEQMNSR